MPADREAPVSRLAHLFAALVPAMAPASAPPLTRPAADWLRSHRETLSDAVYWVLLCEVEHRQELLGSLTLRPVATYSFWVPLHRVDDGWDLRQAWALRERLLLETQRRVVPPAGEW